MHQSSRKQIGTRPDKDDVVAAWDLADAQVERRAMRGAQPKARRFHLRDDPLQDEALRDDDKPQSQS